MTSLYEGPANWLAPAKGAAERLVSLIPVTGLKRIGTVARGGRLTISADEVAFQPHRGNLSREGFRIPVSQVKEATQDQHLGAAILRLHLADGSSVDLISQERTQILDALEKTRH